MGLLFLHEKYWMDLVIYMHVCMYACRKIFFVMYSVNQLQNVRETITSLQNLQTEMQNIVLIEYEKTGCFCRAELTI